MKKQKLNKQQLSKFILDQCNPTGGKIYPPKNEPEYISVVTYKKYERDGITPLNNIEILLNKMGYSIANIEIIKKH